jgi:protein SCO1/2
MLNPLRPLLLGFVCLSFSAGTLTAQDFASFSHDQALAHSQAAIGTALDGVELTLGDGSRVAIEDYRGKPLIISMMYSSCHHVCPSTTAYLNQVVDKARDALGEDSFHVLSIGFDTVADTPERMQQFRVRADVKDSNWDFVAIDPPALDRLSKQLGFIYYPSPKGFEHLVQASVVDAGGVIYRQVYGMSFPVPILVEPLKQLVFGEPREQSMLSYLENRIRLFCTVYDPATDNYQVDVSVFIGTGVGLIVSILFGITLFREWRRSIEADR